MSPLSPVSRRLGHTNSAIFRASHEAVRFCEGRRGTSQLVCPRHRIALMARHLPLVLARMSLPHPALQNEEVSAASIRVAGVREWMDTNETRYRLVRHLIEHNAFVTILHCKAFVFGFKSSARTAPGSIKFNYLVCKHSTS